MRKSFIFLPLFVPMAALAQTQIFPIPSASSGTAQQIQQAQSSASAAQAAALAAQAAAQNATNASSINSGTLGVARLPAQTVSFAAPVEQCSITHGGTYSGLHCQSHDPSKPAIAINTTDAVIIQNSLIESVYFGMSTANQCSLTLTNSTAIQIPSTFGGNPFLYANNCSTLTLTHNHITGFADGMYVAGWSGTGPLTISANRFDRTDDRAPSGDRPGKAGLGHAIIIAGGNYPMGAEISWNHIENLPFESATEDTINLYNAVGTAAHHIVVEHNFINGAHGNIGFQFAYSGTCMVTDGDGSVGFVDILNNRCIGFSNNGIAAAIGHDITISGNTAISTGQIANTDTPGTDAYLRDWLSRFSNDSNNNYLLGGGIYLCAYSATTCYNVTATNNTAGFIGPDGNGVAIRTDFINPAANAGTSVTMTGSTSISSSTDTSTLSTGSVAIAQATQEPTWMSEYAAANSTPVGSDNSIAGSINGQTASPTSGVVGSVAGHTGLYLPSSLDSRSLDVYRWSIFLTRPFLPFLCLGPVTQYYGGACATPDGLGNLSIPGLRAQNFATSGFSANANGNAFFLPVHVYTDSYFGNHDQAHIDLNTGNITSSGSSQFSSLSTNQAGQTGTTCTIAGYLTLTIDGILRKLGYCQ